jgi:hypothetical protein
LLKQAPAGWAKERARLARDKAALQRECRGLLERLQAYQAQVPS